MSLYEQWMMSGPVASVAPDLNFVVMPVRENGSGPDGRMVSFVGGNSWYIPAGARNAEAAWEYIKFMHTDDTWMIGAEATRTLREEQGDRPFIPSLTGSRTADQLQIELYEPVAGPFDDAVNLFPQILEESFNRDIGRSPVAGQLDDIMQDEGIEPAFGGQVSAQEALDQADQSAQDAIDSF